MAVRAWLALLLTVTALGGCVDDTPEPRQEAPLAEEHAFAGTVTTPAFNPIPDAVVSVEQPITVFADSTHSQETQRVQAVTDANGVFDFAALWPGSYTFTVDHPDYAAATFDAEVPLPANQTASVTLTALVDPPYIEQFPFDGYFECGADHLIFAGSCDEFAGEVVPPVEGTFTDEREFFIDVSDEWETVVVDIYFEDIPQTLDGLRLAAYAPAQDAAVLTYERYHQAGGSEPFTLRIEPGVDYGDALPAPEGETTIRFEVFPRGYGYHEVCDPSGDTCFTGIGASARVDFELIATVFYREPAPEGWTLIA